MTIDNRKSPRSPWYWIPTLYFGEGLPYVVVMTVSVIMYKRFDISNEDIAFYTSWLYLPWVIKPLWSPVVDLLKTKRFWIITLQLFIGAALAGVALTIPMPSFFQYTLAIFWLMAFSSATHDIAADGFYMLALSEGEQAFFVGVRSTFYRIAMISAQGLLVILAGTLESQSVFGLGGNIVAAWSVTFGVLALLFFLFFLYHKFMLPVPKADVSSLGGRTLTPPQVLAMLAFLGISVVAVYAAFKVVQMGLQLAGVGEPWLSVVSILAMVVGVVISFRTWIGSWIVRKEANPEERLLPLIEFLRTFVSFVRKEGFWLSLLFLMLFRLGEAQLVKMATPFLLDKPELGGIGLATSDIGIVYGTVGVISLTLGGIIGGIAVSRHGLGAWLWPMVLAINVPDLVYVYLAAFQPQSFLLINACVAVEQLGYGFGFTAYMMYMIYISRGQYATAHYAICTGFMALGMMLPGMVSGSIQQSIGYSSFFIWVCLATIPGFVLAKMIKIEPEFGKKSST